MGKDSFAIHTSYEELTNIPSPFIAHVITNVDLFLFITKVTAESIQTIDEKGKIESISRKDFEDMWDGNILIMDNRPGKISIPLKMKFSTIIKQIKYPMLILCVAILFAYLLILKHEGGILFYLYLTGVLGGLTASILLFVDQIDKYNVHIKKLCSATGNKNNIDCSSILDFKDAYFLGLVSWSDIGFVYFLSLLIVLLFLPFGTAQALINFLSVCSIGYVCYSLFYQKFKNRNMPYSYFQSYLCFMHKRATKTNAHPSKKSQYQIGFNIFVRPKETSRIDSNSFPYSLWLSKESPIICHDTKKIC